MSLKVPPTALARAHGGDSLFDMGQKWVETFELWANLNTKDRILDIGCGPGRMALALRQKFGWRAPRYVGFDIKRRDIRFCRKAFRWRLGFRFHLIDILNDHYNPTGTASALQARFPVKRGVSTFCLATSIFTHFYQAEVAHYLSEAYRCLAPGGRLFSTWFLLEKDVARSNKARFTFQHENEDGTKSEVEHPRRRAVAFSKAEALRLLADAGFIDAVIHRGGWRRDKKGYRHSQDVIIAIRPVLFPA